MRKRTVLAAAFGLASVLGSSHAWADSCLTYADEFNRLFEASDLITPSTEEQASRTAQAKEAYVQGMTLHETGQHADAIAAFQQAIDIVNGQ